MSFNTEAIQKYWKYLESRSIAPEKISKISIIKFEDLKEACDKKNEFYIKSLIKKMYNGSAFIVRGAAKKIILFAHSSKKTLYVTFFALIVYYSIKSVIFFMPNIYMKNKR